MQLVSVLNHLALTHTHKHNRWAQKQPKPRRLHCFGSFIFPPPALSCHPLSLFSQTGWGCPFLFVQLGNANGNATRPRKLTSKHTHTHILWRKQNSNMLCVNGQQEIHTCRLKPMYKRKQLVVSSFCFWTSVQDSKIEARGRDTMTEMWRNR